MRAMSLQQPARPFSLPLFGTLAGAWQDWRNGIPPGREWVGRGAQNPWLLLAFAALDRAQATAQGEARESLGRQRESRESFEARITREVTGR